MSANGLFINYEFCTRCHSCEVACKKEHKLPKGQFGMRVLQDGPRQMLDGQMGVHLHPVPLAPVRPCALSVRRRGAFPPACITARRASWNTGRSKSL